VKFSDGSRTTGFRILKLYEDKCVAFIRGTFEWKVQYISAVTAPCILGNYSESTGAAVTRNANVLLVLCSVVNVASSDNAKCTQLTAFYVTLTKSLWSPPLAFLFQDLNYKRICSLRFTCLY
jgi:hypothetical protein